MFEEELNYLSEKLATLETKVVRVKKGEIKITPEDYEALKIEFRLLNSIFIEITHCNLQHQAI